MAKINLGARPKNFKHTITVKMLDGTTASIECLYKYRTRKEFGELIDKMSAAALEAAKRLEAGATAASDDAAAEVKAFSLKDFQSRTIDSNVEYVMNILDGWNLDIELNREAVEQLADEYPGATAAIVEAYRAAITEGRLGN